MPALNPDYFTDVLIQCLKKENDSRTLGKFMLTGRQQFRCALNYFSKVKFVDICDSFMRVYVKIGGVTHQHEISYQFSMIYLIMKAIAPSLEEMNICKCPESFDSIEFFLKYKIKKVEVLQWLPDKYRKVIASCDFIERISVRLVGDPLPLDMIPPACRELKIKIWSFYKEYINKTMKLSIEYLKNIEKLEIDAPFDFPKRYIASFILKNFSKLQSIDVVVTYHDYMKYVIAMFKDRKLMFLQRLGKSNVTGKLAFKNRIRPKSKCVIPKFDKFLQDVSDIAGVTSDPENQTITRTVELKENLIAEFLLVFSVDSCKNDLFTSHR